MNEMSFSAERWAQIQLGFDEVLELDPESRTRRLMELALEDPELEREIQSLLHAYGRDEEIGAMLRDAGLGDLARSEPARVNSQVGPYRIVQEIGRGGMGVIYRAVDTRLGRPVALKFLPSHLHADREAEARFLIEARAASALDHPNICTVHEVGRTDEGQFYIAMAFYEGRTLAQRIAEGPLSIEESIHFAHEIADALSRAHEAGIIHRDMKPSNVMITDRGELKILDFGLAKLVDHSMVTRAGALLGTTAYMSPEQTRGADIDARTDVWGVGVMLYEMLTGSRPFRAENEQAVIYVVRHDEPRPVEKVRHDVPEGLAYVVRRMLEKDPSDRYPTMADVCRDLAALRDSGKLWSPNRYAFYARAWGAGASLIALVTVAALFRPARELNRTVDAAGAGIEVASSVPALAGAAIQIRQIWSGPDVDDLGTPSPDGTLLSFTDWETGNLAVREIATGAKRPLTSKGGWDESVAYAQNSVISADGRQVAYAWFGDDENYRLSVVGIDGEAPRVVFDREPLGFIRPYEWSPDSRSVLAVVWPGDNTGQIVRIDVRDGKADVLKTIDQILPFKMGFDPEGEMVAYDYPQEHGSTDHDIFLLNPATGTTTPVVRHPSHDFLLGWTPDGGSLLFASNRTGLLGLWRQELSGTSELDPPVLVKADIGRIGPLGFTRDGSYYFSLQVGNLDVYLADFDPVTGRLTSAAEPIDPRYMGVNKEASWSRDGRYLAYVAARGSARVAAPALVIRSVETGEERVLRPALKNFYMPKWSPDGRFVLVDGFDTEGTLGYFRVDVATGAVRRLMIREGTMSGPSWSVDGRSIYYRRMDPVTDASIFVRRELETGRERELFRVERPAILMEMRLSNDGSRIAAVINNSVENTSRLQIVPLDGGSRRELLNLTASDGKQVTDAVLGTSWSPDDDYVYFGRRRDTSDVRFQMWRIPVQGGEAERILTDVQLRNLNFHPNGRRISFTAGENRAEIWRLEHFLDNSRSSERSS